MTRRHRWLLARIAAQNLGRRRWRAIFLGAAVMLAVGVGFAGFVAGSALRAGIAASFARMGADLLVVPRATLVNLTASLLTVQPTDETLDANLEQSLAALPGIARVAPQRIVSALVDGRLATLIAFDPARDFSVLTWLEQHEPGALSADGLIAGGRAAAPLGEELAVCGKPLTVYGRLGVTGVGPFDDSYFVTFDALAAIVAFCRTAGPSRHAEGEACPAELPPGRVSAFLLQLSPGAKAQDIKFAISRLADVRVVEGNTVLTSSRQGLVLLLAGIAVFAVLQFAALLIVLALLFSATIEERCRELGLLRAMGAKPGQVSAVILAEAAILTGLGGAAGLVFGAALLLTFARSLGFYFALLGIPFSWPPPAVLAAGGAGALVLAALLGAAGAFLPAWRVRRAAPYELIRLEAP
jgi:putative ABC transport system permease protein